MTTYSRYLAFSFLSRLGWVCACVLLLVAGLTLGDCVLYLVRGIGFAQIALITSCYILSFFSELFPIMVLIASFLIFRDLTKGRELVTWQSLGLPIQKVIAPLLTLSIGLGLLNFYILNTVAPAAKNRSDQAWLQQRNMNPLSLLDHPHIRATLGAYVQFDPVKSGKEIDHLCLALGGSHLSLLLTPKVQVIQDQIRISKSVLLTSMPNAQGEDHLFLESVDTSQSPSLEIRSLLYTHQTKLSREHLSWRLLNQYASYLQKQPSNSKIVSKQNKCISEKLRRMSLLLAPISYFVLGMTMGMQSMHSKEQKAKHLLYLLGTGLLLMTAYLFGKSLDRSPWNAGFLFFIPQLCVLGFGMMRVYSMGWGKE